MPATTTAASCAGPPQPTLAQRFPRFSADAGSSRLRQLERLRERARRFAQQHARGRALEIDRRAREDPRFFDWELVRAGASEGLLSFLIPKQAGGGGGLATEAAIVMEELCAACPGIALIFGAHALGISPLLLGGPSQWDGVLAQLVASEAQERPMLMACAITEPEAGTDVEDPDLLARGRITTHARPVPGGYRLTGTKRFISNGSVARWITILMPTDPRNPAQTWTCFLLDTRSEGFSIARVESKMGQRACPAAELSLQEVFVPAERVVGRPGDGAAATMIVLACSRPPVAAIATGIASGAYERVRDWIASGGQAADLRNRQHVQLQLASMEEEIHLARQAYIDAATEVDQVALGGALRHPLVRALGHVPPSVRRSSLMRGWITSPRAADATVAVMRRTTSDRAVTRSLALSSLAKAHCADVAMRVTTAALDLVGMRDVPVRAELQKLWRDAKLTQIYEGTNQLNRIEVHRGLCAQETISCLPPLRAAAHPNRESPATAAATGAGRQDPLIGPAAGADRQLVRARGGER